MSPFMNNNKKPGVLKGKDSTGPDTNGLNGKKMLASAHKRFEKTADVQGKALRKKIKG